MKRKKEVEIVVTVLSEHGFPETPELKKAIEEGLKTLRQQKFHEKRWAKAQCGRRKMAEKKQTKDSQPG